MPWELSDVALYVSTNEGLTGTTRTLIRTVDAFTGLTETVVGPRVSGVQPVDDIAMRQDGELFGYAVGPATGGINDGNTQDYLLFDTGDGSASNRGGSDILTFFRDSTGNKTQGNNNAGFGFNIDAITFQSTGVSGGLMVGHRNITGTQLIDPMNDNVLFLFNVDSGRAAHTAMDVDDTNGRQADIDAGTNRPVIGWINTLGDGSSNITGGLGGLVTGIAFPDSSNGSGFDGYAITDRGELHQFFTNVDFTAGDGSVQSNYLADIGSMIGRPGIDFQGLAAGPDDIEPLTSASFRGRYEDILFAISSDGLLVAIDIGGITTSGSGTVELAPIFFDSQSFIQLTDENGFTLNNITGLDFGTLTRNLWHLSGRNNGDTGSGPDTPFDFSRDIGDDAPNDGDFALFFGNELAGSLAGNKNNRGQNSTRADVENIDFPNGAHGSVISNEFDLSPYTIDDKPFLDFNYYLQTENTDAAWSADTPADNNPMRDSFRVFIGGDDGVWNLVATNNSLQPTQFAQRPADEFDYGPADPNDPLSIQEPITDGTGIYSQFPLGQNFPDVVELYDDPNFNPSANKAWRSARVDLSNYAGRDNLRLRFDFSTAGGMDFADGAFGLFDNDVTNAIRNEEIRVLPAAMLTDGERFELDGDGNFTDIDAFNAGNTGVTVRGEHFEFDLGYVFLAPSGASINDGDTFTIDGTVFEFEKDYPSAATNAAVITDQFTTGQVAQAIAAAVNSAGISGVTAIVVGNRVNIVGATSIPTSGSSVQNATGTPSLIVDGTPGVRTGHHAVPITLDMDRSEVAEAVKTALSTVFSVPRIIGSGGFRAGYIDEAVTPNNSIATGFVVDLAPWNTNTDANVANGLALDTVPHISIIGRGDTNDGTATDTADYYGFSANTGDVITLDIDNTSTGYDSYLRVFQSNGTEITSFTIDGHDDFGGDAGSTSGLDSFIQFTAPITDTFYVEVTDFPGTDPVPLGALYELHITVTGHTLLAARPEVADTEPNDSIAAAQDLDAEPWALIADNTVNDRFGADISGSAPHITAVGTNVGSSDFYSFTVTDGEQLRLDLDSSSSSGFFVLNVYDGAGTQLAGWNGTAFVNTFFANDNGSPNNVDPTVSLTVVSSNGVGTTDTYFVEVAGWPLNPASTGYRLHVVLPSQPDNSAAYAQIPETGGTTTVPNIDPTNIKGFSAQGFLEIIGHNVTNQGPLGWSNTLPGDEFGAFGVGATSAGGWNRSAGALRGVNNRIEGVWLDDIIIGLAERGSTVTDAPVDDSFMIDTRIYNNRFFGNGDVDRDHINYTGT
ncbi:MAG: PPC domain-containing protein, partial [Planctomycetaceae bacterium]|nr:PPC domain-containing protein [Planctomycetaceae bacterium]